MEELREVEVMSVDFTSPPSKTEVEATFSFSVM
jgi:hypothetical protein